MVGEWLVHPHRDLLVRAGEARKVEARTMDVLVYLVAHAGQVVSKNDIIDAVWERHFIAEGTLTSAVAELRAALGDDPHQPRYIETIPKRGYRLVAAVADAATDEGNPAATRGRGRRRVAAVAVAAGLAAAVTSILIVRGSPSLDPERVLVLPLANRSGDREAGQLALMARDRMVEVAVNAGLGRMVVGARPAATQEEAVRMGRSAHAAIVVTGSVDLRNGETEVEAQLLDATASGLLYAVPPVPVRHGQAAAAAAELGDRVLGAVATHMRAHAHACLLSHTPSFAAYREFIAGSERFGTDYDEALLHLRRAAELDPAYTSAWIRLAVACEAVGRFDEARSIFARLEARRQELTPFERLCLDFYAQRYAHPLQAYVAIRQLDRTVPGDPIFTVLGGQQALRLNRPREALRWLGVAPRPVPYWIARNVMAAGEYWGRATAMHMLGDFAGELAVAREGVRRYPDVMDLRRAEARALAAVGDRHGLESAISTADETPPEQGSAGWVILEGAAAARAHGQPTLAAELSARAAQWFAQAGERQSGIEIGLAESLFHVGGSALAPARGVLERGVAGLPAESSRMAVQARGWLGAVAARQGDVQRAAELDAWLAGVSDPRLHDDALFYRAAIAAWRGRRTAAADLFRQALAAGWGRFDALHDLERILLEPVARDPYFAAILAPDE